MHKPAAYWRANTQWQKWLGKRGTVVASTVVHVAPPHLSAFVPYTYAIVDVEGERREYMGADHQLLQAGDEVECVLRRMCVPGEKELIPYGIKVAKVQL